MRVVSLVTVIIVFTLTFSGFAVADKFAGSIQLTSNPETLAADGKSVATIGAQVRDRQGNLAPDGTTVRFSTSLGVIEQSATTMGGVARVKLVSGTIKGTAVIMATWVEGQATAQLDVAFGDQAAAVSGPSYVTVEADDYLAYSADKKTIDATGNVRIRYRSIKIEALSAQIDLEKGRIVAKGDDRSNVIRVRTSDGVLQGNSFFGSLTGSGVLISAKSGVKELNMTSGIPIVGDKTQRYNSWDFDYADLSDSHVLVRAKRATVFLHDRIQFEKARVYLDGKKIITMPLYVLSMNGYEVDGEQYIGYGDNGVKLNLPVYYSLSPTSTGALLVQHGEPTATNWCGSNYGWSLDMRQKYQTDTAHGVFELSQITTGDWGAHFSHTEHFGAATQTYLYLDYAQHKDLFGNFNIDRTFKTFDLGMNAYGSDYSGGTNSLTTDLHVQLHPKPIGELPLHYTISSHLGYLTSNYLATATGYTTTTDPTTGMQVLTPTVEQTKTETSGFNESLQGDLYSNPLPITKKLFLSTSVTLGYLWGHADEATGLTQIASAVMDWKISPSESAQFSYRFADNPSVYTTVVGKQSLSGLWRYMIANKLVASVYGLKGLDYSTTNVYGDLSYKLSKPWRIGVRATWNLYQSASYDDLQIQLGRMIGNREFCIVWSKALNRFMLDLGSGTF
jgi:hypothetical protein